MTGMIVVSICVYECMHVYVRACFMCLCWCVYVRACVCLYCMSGGGVRGGGGNGDDMMIWQIR